MEAQVCQGTTFQVATRALTATDEVERYSQPFRTSLLSTLVHKATLVRRVSEVSQAEHDVEFRFALLPPPHFTCDVRSPCEHRSNDKARICGESASRHLQARSLLPGSSSHCGVSRVGSFDMDCGKKSIQHRLDPLDTNLTFSAIVRYLMECCRRECCTSRVTS